MIYYLIQAYQKEVDEQYSRHLYPSYLTSYNRNVGGDGFGLQSGYTDALKFTTTDDTKPYLEKALEYFGDKYEFEVVPYDNRIFGRAEIKYVVSLEKIN